MKFPKLKHPLMCRITSYVVFLGAFVLPAVVVICIPVLSDLVKVIVSLACMTGLLVFLFYNFANLMAMDIIFATLQGYQGAYREYPLKTDVQTLEKRLCRFGIECEPIALHPKPQMLRYKSTAPMTVYSGGIEKVVAVYRCGLLTKEEYHRIFNSAAANSQALAGKKKHWFLDKEQKKAPLNRVTVILILATAVEPTLSEGLYDLVCKNQGDGFDVAVMPCVVDLSAKACVFNSPREPYFGMQYPVKNRGNKLIKKYIFGGKFPKGTGNLLDEEEDFDKNQSLWQLWKELQNEFRDQNRKLDKKLKEMNHGQILVEDEQVLLKLEDRGAVWPINCEEKSDVLEVVVCAHWDYPKVRPISKKHTAVLKDMVQGYFDSNGTKVRFVTIEEII